MSNIRHVGPWVFCSATLTSSIWPRPGPSLGNKFQRETTVYRKRQLYLYRPPQTSNSSWRQDRDHIFVARARREKREIPPFPEDPKGTMRPLAGGGLVVAGGWVVFLLCLLDTRGGVTSWVLIASPSTSSIIPSTSTIAITHFNKRRSMVVVVVDGRKMVVVRRGTSAVS